MKWIEGGMLFRTLLCLWNRRVSKKGDSKTLASESLYNSDTEVKKAVGELWSTWLE